MVSVVHIYRGDYSGRHLLDDRPVKDITSYLFHAGGNDEPDQLIQNAHKSFIGHFISGAGFTFDDTDNSGLATSIAEMNGLISKDPRNSERVFPYIGGEEVLNDPRHLNHRFVINFELMTESEAERWPDLMNIIRKSVKPERKSLPPKNAWNRAIAEKWWLFGAYRKELREATKKLPRVLFHPNLSSNSLFAFLPSHIIVGAPHNVFAFDDYQPFCVLQSRLHDCWAWFFGSTFKDDLRYTPSRCFETFPFPSNYETISTLEAAGQAYYTFRAELMIRNNEGLTKTYNRFHDPEERSPDILKLRELHAAMDKAVLEAYGWHDLAKSATCEFLLDYEEDEDDEDNGGGRGRRRKKPWRYRWPDDFRDEVLARLLELNRQRAEEERLSGLAADGSDKKKGKRGKKAAKADPKQSDLFG